jgi:alanine-glyoxylate transaminase/serine-glyoxylate transaminase/serine-pyruvate transaminase
MNTFNPPIRTLMGPGPSDVHPRILQALSRPTIGHLDPKFVELMDDIKVLLKYSFQTENELTFCVSAPGSAGMETCFVNLVEPGDKVLVAINGVFGTRMKENVERAGGVVLECQFEWGKPVDPFKIEEILKENSDIKIVSFVHAETSTGVLSDAKEIGRIAKKYNCLTILDAVTSLAGSELKIDEWEIDAVYSGTQKCLSCIPGLSPVSFSKRAVEKIKNRKTKVQSWFLDLNLVMGYWGSEVKRSYHHTAPVNSLYALHESLVMLKEEGLSNSIKRHFENYNFLREELNKMEIDFLVDEKYRTPQLNAIKIPSGVDDQTIRSKLLSKYNLEIGAGLGPLAGKIWRIGLMGTSSNYKNIILFTEALKREL